MMISFPLHSTPRRWEPTMSKLRRQLLGILSIGHDTSMRGEGISLRDALHRTDYSSVRDRFDAKDLVPLVRANPKFVDQWIAYSEDKRTSGGWWICLDPPSIGQVKASGSSIPFKTADEAIAEYVVRELDFWVTVK